MRACWAFSLVTWNFYLKKYLSSFLAWANVRDSLLGHLRYWWLYHKVIPQFLLGRRKFTIWWELKLWCSTPKKRLFI
jgi:hypothetical protein